MEQRVHEVSFFNVDMTKFCGWFVEQQLVGINTQYDKHSRGNFSSPDAWRSSDA
jgi:hypothetical protein